MIKLPTKMY